MPNQVEKTPLADDSALQSYVQPGDFVDCYSVHSELPARKAAEIITDFPSWAGALLALRNLAVRPLGLRPEGPVSDDMVGIFPVVDERADEIIAGFDDRHLDFRVSVVSRGGRVALATWVHRNNLVGRIYLALIMPFHILIARNALARVARHGASGKAA